MGNFFLITNKLMELKGFKKPGELYSWLGVRKSTFYTWRDREEIPDKKIIQIATQKGIPVSDLFLEGPQNAGEEEDQNNYLEGGEVRITRLLKDAEKLLRSKTPFGRALATNIDAFMLGYDSWKDDDPQKKGRGGAP